MDREEEYGIKIFVGCLPADFNEEELYNYFSSYCKISQISIKYRSNKVCSGHGSFFCFEPLKLPTLLGRIHFFKNRCLEVRRNLEGEEHLAYQEEFNKRRLYIENLPSDATDIDLCQLFQTVAPIERAYKANRPDKHGNYFGFVILKDQKFSKDVINSHLYLEGRRIMVKMADRAGTKKSTKINKKKINSTEKKKKKVRNKQVNLKNSGGFRERVMRGPPSSSFVKNNQLLNIKNETKMMRKSVMRNQEEWEDENGYAQSIEERQFFQNDCFTYQNYYKKAERLHLESFNNSRSLKGAPNYQEFYYSRIQIHPSRSLQHPNNHREIKKDGHIKRAQKFRNYCQKPRGGRIDMNKKLLLSIKKGIRRVSSILDFYHKTENLRYNKVESLF